MAKLHRIHLGDRQFHARSGQMLLDAALLNGVELPHDCRAGRCGSCLTRIRAGITLGGETRTPGMVHACQARVFSELKLEVEALPPAGRVNGTIESITRLAADIVEVTIRPSQPVTMLDGQYCRFRFRGYPARSFSPTSPLSALQQDGLIRLNVKQVRGGRVTQQLGAAIKPGHAVVVEGPFGHAFLRRGRDNRLVLVGSGTGFAPVWAVAAAALRENPRRSMVQMAPVRKLAALYMAPALDLACRHRSVSVIACVEELKQQHGQLRPGGAREHLPALRSSDIVYAAGAPKLVEAVGDAAQAAGAMFYADPFEPQSESSAGWLDSAKAWLRAG